MERLNLRCNPYRGILVDVGKELGITPTAVLQGVYPPKKGQNPNPKHLEVFMKHVEKRTADYKALKERFDSTMKAAV